MKCFLPSPLVVKILNNDPNLHQACEEIADSDDLKQQLKDYALRLPSQLQEQTNKHSGGIVTQNSATNYRESGTVMEEEEHM